MQRDKNRWERKEGYGKIGKIRKLLEMKWVSIKYYRQIFVCDNKMLQPIKVHWTTGGLNSSQLQLWTRFITWNKVSKFNKCTNNAFMSNGLNGIFPPKNAFFQPRCIWYCLKQSWKKKTDVATTNIGNTHYPKLIPGFSFCQKTLNLINYVFISSLLLAPESAHSLAIPTRRYPIPSNPLHL